LGKRYCSLDLRGKTVQGSAGGERIRWKLQTNAEGPRPPKRKTGNDERANLSLNQVATAREPRFSRSGKEADEVLGKVRLSKTCPSQLTGCMEKASKNRTYLTKNHLIGTRKTEQSSRRNKIRTSGGKKGHFPLLRGSPISVKGEKTVA